MLSCCYRTTILAAVAFLDAFQKVADMATSSRGKRGDCQSVWPHTQKQQIKSKQSFVQTDLLLSYRHIGYLSL